MSPFIYNISGLETSMYNVLLCTVRMSLQFATNGGSSSFARASKKQLTRHSTIATVSFSRSAVREFHWKNTKLLQSPFPKLSNVRNERILDMGSFNLVSWCLTKPNGQRTPLRCVVEWRTGCGSHVSQNVMVRKDVKDIIPIKRTCRLTVDCWATGVFPGTGSFQFLVWFSQLV